VIKNVRLENGAESLRGIAVSPDGKYVYATHLLARYLVPTTQVERGWINTSAVSILRVSDQTLLSTVLLDDVDRGFANPWGIAISKDASLMAVVAAGTHELSLIDIQSLIEKVENHDEESLATHNNLSFISDLRQRVPLKGNGPRSLAIAGDQIYATEYFSDSLAQVHIEDGKMKSVASIRIGPKLPMTTVRRGEMLFNDARMCFQNWQSCASCHPDARADGLNWDLLNDGIGNPKNAKSLILSHKTPPVMALGVRTSAEVAVRAGMRYIQFVVRPDEDAQAIDAYLLGLEPDPSPYLRNGKLTEAAKRGRTLFEETGCIACHPAPTYTNLKQYDVGTGKGQDEGKPFDVPTLCEVWRTAPYLHDGRATSIYEVIRKHNHGNKRGNTAGLSDDEIRDLADYVLSL
jgi:mono/diheme cytochrome c family protein